MNISKTSLAAAITALCIRRADLAAVAPAFAAPFADEIIEIDRAITELQAALVVAHG